MADKKKKMEEAAKSSMGSLPKQKNGISKAGAAVKKGMGGKLTKGEDAKKKKSKSSKNY